MVHYNLRKGYTFVFMICATGLLPTRGFSADFVSSPNCFHDYLVTLTKGSTEGETLKAGPVTLNDRVWKAFYEEFAKMDPVLEPSSRVDLISHDALVKALIDPQEAAVSLAMAIRQAKHEVTIGTYIFGKDAYAQALLKEVKDAIGRGVDVHVLIDAEGTPGLQHNELKMLNDVPRGKALDDFGNPTDRLAKVNTSIFNPPSHFFEFLPKYVSHFHNLHETAADAKNAARMFTRRMHTKIAGVDMDYPEGIAFLGGRNKDGLYYGYEKVGPRTYNDTEIMVRNDLTDFYPGKKTLSNTLAREFRKLYGHTLNREIAGLTGGAESSTYARLDAKMTEAHASMWKPGGDYDLVLKRLENENFLETGFDRSNTTLLSEIENIHRESAWANVNEIGEKNLTSITKNIHHYIKLADKAITIVTPYPNMTLAERTGLIQKMLNQPDLKFTLVTNSLYSGDNIITQFVVDHKLIPALKLEAKNAALKSGMTDVDADKFVDRFEIYALGKMDGPEFGGNQTYGKLHAKYAQFFSKNSDKSKTVVGSYNGDNISRYHNSEVAVSVPGEGNTSQAFIEKTQELISKSYKWGSPEWLKLRASKPLRKKRLIESVVRRLESFVDPIE
jgi:phosphatidylserine/phosphatidylglycerophosphate/cardiolipin synthase-like enzyme